MSDFLTDLIRRQDEVADGVRPRLPSLFEPNGAAAPVPRPGAPLSELTVEEEAPAAPGPARATRPLPRPGPQMPTVPAQDANDSQPAVGPVQRAAPAERQPMQVPEPPTERQPPTPPLVPRETRPVAKTETRPASAFAPEEPVPVIRPSIDRRPTRVSPLLEKTENVETPRQSNTRRIVETVVLQSPAPAIAPTPQPSRPEQVAAAPPPFAMPPAQPGRQRREGQRDPPEPPHAQAEPSIHVTIGRIEIRAIEDREPRARRRDAPSPVMTLEDYLKSRAKR